MNKMGRKIKFVAGEGLHLLTFVEFHLKVEMRKGYVGDDDVSCESKSMLSIMYESREAICTKFQWVTYDNIIYLVM